MASHSVIHAWYYQEDRPLLLTERERLQGPYYIPNIRHHIQIQSSWLWGICLNWFSLLRLLQQPTQINEVHMLYKMIQFTLNLTNL